MSAGKILRLCGVVGSFGVVGAFVCEGPVVENGADQVGGTISMVLDLPLVWTFVWSTTRLRAFSHPRSGWPVAHLEPAKEGQAP